ncbi:MAG: ATP phosphoribosyltransferase regulatory subunit [Clostridia bacterium]|nr:ATP phosphoribosyltransferase regulatory subunit [Clostridia bacterium]
MKINTSPVRGTIDYLPKDMEIRQNVYNIIIKSFKENGYLQIKTPILESLSILTNGDSGDNQKLMFKTIKRGEKLKLDKPNLTEADIVEEGLRYDLTVPLARLYAGNREKLPFPFKAIQIDDSFRAERPQRGRYRQFTQCDIDIWGDSSVNAEIDLLVSAINTYEKIGFTKLKLKINDRRILSQVIVNSGISEDSVIDVNISLDKLDKIGIDGVKQELIEKGYKEDNVTKLLDTISAVKDTCDLNKTKDILLNAGVEESIIDGVISIIDVVSTFSTSTKVVYDITVIRGQGYYTGTVFEMYDESSDFTRAIGGGGRYDRILERFIGTSVPAVGYSIGLEPVVLLLLENNKAFESKKLVLLYNKEDNIIDVLKAKQDLISKGYEVSIYLFPKNFKNFLERMKESNFVGFVKLNDIANIQSI